jgi:hypothetical protein
MRSFPLSSRLGGLAALVLSSLPIPARAQTSPPPAERHLAYSPYEAETIDEVLADRHAVRDSAPEGKTVESIDVVPLDVFEKRDLLPTWLNVFHATTRPYVIRREVLLKEGGPYTQALVDDTIRNLRRVPGVPQLSAVLVVPTVGSDAKKVQVLVITKDVWSLRLNWNAVATTGGIEQLALQPSENNFLGTHQILSSVFVLEPAAYTVGVGYTVPSVDASRVAINGSGNVMVNRQSGHTEGSYGSLVAGQPLYSGNVEWSWDSSAAWQDAIVRRYVNAALSYFVVGNSSVPFEYRERTYIAQEDLTRSFGWDVKHDFTAGLGVNRGEYLTNFDGFLTAPPATVADFVGTEVPVSDTRAGPSLQYHSYTTRFVRVFDFDTLALQEDYRLGHDVVVRFYPSFRAIGSTRDVYGVYGGAQYTWAIRDGVFRVSVESTTEYSSPTPQGSPATGTGGAQSWRISDASFVPTAHLVSPSIGRVGRIVLDGTLLWRWRNYLRQTTTIGGDDRLRGYPTNFFVGQNVFAYNVEFRTRPVEILSCELGAVAFYDVGDAANGPIGSLHPYQSVGAGIRALFPWLDRTVFRADLGVPLQRPPMNVTSGPPIAPVGFVITFDQAFDTPSVAPPPVLPTGQGTDSP